MFRELTSGEAAAICYADVFNYPLTSIEIEKFQISSYKSRTKKFNSLNYFTESQGYFFMKGRDKVIQLRNKREKWSGDKLKIADQVMNYLRFIPTIQMVAVTGALAMENCDRDDDIDLLIVSKPGTVWTTRFFTIILLELLGKRRRPKQIHSSNKICLNMFLDEDHLGVPEKERDLFSAHEVAQVKVLWSRGEVEKKFWTENEWINKFLPNINIQSSKLKENPDKNNSKLLILSEWFLKKIQLFYMNSRRTNEVIRDGYLRFHPNDARKWIIPEYEERLALLGLK